MSEQTPAADGPDQTEPVTGGRKRKPAPEPATDTTATPTPAPSPAGEAASPRPGTAPFPGPEFFHAGRHSPLIHAMGRRLVAEDCGHYLHGPGPNWTRADARSYAAWQTQCGLEPTGTPDEESWNRLAVPRTA